jgi:hypothetical protein
VIVSTTVEADGHLDEVLGMHMPVAAWATFGGLLVDGMKRRTPEATIDSIEFFDSQSRLLKQVTYTDAE